MRINPSILSADFGNLQAALESIKSADAAHIDVMDNHFVPNLTIGLPVVKRLQEITPIPLDVHLMIERPDTEALRYAEFAVDSITFHLEASNDPIQLCKKLREMSVKPAISIKPATPVQQAIDLLDYVDMVLVMTVEPGFGGQKLIDKTLEKLPDLRKAIDSQSREIYLQVDGGITEQNIGAIAALGADSFVAGSAVFSNGNPAERIAVLRAAAHRQ